MGDRKKFKSRDGSPSSLLPAYHRYVMDDRCRVGIKDHEKRVDAPAFTSHDAFCKKRAYPILYIRFFNCD